jgi:hypothetical protein
LCASGCDIDGVSSETTKYQPASGQAANAAHTSCRGPAGVAGQKESVNIMKNIIKHFGKVNHLTLSDRAKLVKEARRTGYSVKQLLEIRKEAARDAVLDEAAYSLMTQPEKDAHDNL